MTVSKHQQQVRKRHEQLIRLYEKLKDAGLPRMVMWGELEKKTNYTRVGLQKILKKNGIKY